MADPLSVQCPHCKVKLKLKAAPAAGKKIGCPKCKKPFAVPVPAQKKEGDDDFLDALDGLAENDYESPEDEDSQDDDEDAAPSRSSVRSRGGSTKKGIKGKKGRSKKSSLGPLLAIIGGSVAALAIVVGLIYFLMSMPGGGGVQGLRSESGEFIAFAPSDADIFIAARPADILASPLMASLNQNPQAKMGLAQFEQQFGFPLAEIDHAFVAMKINPNAAGGAAAAGGNPMMAAPGGVPGGPPGGMPAGMAMPGAAAPGAIQPGAQDVVVMLRLKKPYGGKSLEQISQQAPTKSHNGVTYHVSPGANGGAFFFGDDKHVVMGEPTLIEKIIDRKDQAEDKALLAYFAKEQHLTIVASPKGAAAQSSLAPGFSPALMQSADMQKMVQEISMVRLDINMPGGIDLKGAVTCKSEAAAQQIHAETTKQIDQLKLQAMFLKLMVPDIDTVINTLQVTLSGSTMSVAASVPSAMIEKLKQQVEQQAGLGSPGVALPSGGLPPGVTPGTTLTGALPTASDGTGALTSGQPAQARTKATNQLKQVLRAFVSYHDAHKTLPASFSVDANGQPLLSWRVHILPYIEQKSLYDQFHLNEPWDSEHNQTLIAKLPNTYASPDEPELVSQGMTRILVPTGPGMAFEGSAPLMISDFLDGTSNTLMAVEVASAAAVVWTKPDDLIIDATMPHQSLIGSRGEEFLAAFADGSVRAIKESIAADLLLALFTRKGAEVIPENAF